MGFIVISTYTYIDIYIYTYIYIYTQPGLICWQVFTKWSSEMMFFFMSFCKCCQISTSNDAYGHQKSSKKKRDFHKMSANRPDISQPFFLIPFRRPESRGHHLGRDLGMSSQAWAGSDRKQVVQWTKGSKKEDLRFI